MSLISVIRSFQEGGLRRLGAASLVGVMLSAGSVGAVQAQTAPKSKLTVAVASASFAWLPYLVAAGAGYIGEEGIEVENVSIGTNTAPIAALLSGSVDVAAVGVQAALAAVAKKQPIRVLTPLSSEFTSMMFARKDSLSKAKISPDAPIEQRVRALKGMKVAVCSAGCSTDLLLRHLLATYAPELNPDRDLQIVPIVEASSVLASMSRGLVDVAMFSPPVPQKAAADGYAQVYIDTIAGEVPATRGMLFTALLITEKSLKERPQELRGLVRALDRALKLIHADPVKAGAAARQFMPKMDDDLWNAAMRKVVAATPKDPFVSVEGLKKYGALISSGGNKYEVNYDALPVNDLVAAALKEKR
ncbi:MAG: ABC transporter substrate-binding protein [Burkholderiaceae bacterium]